MGPRGRRIAKRVLIGFVLFWVAAQGAFWGGYFIKAPKYRRLHAEIGTLPIDRISFQTGARKTIESVVDDKTKDTLIGYIKGMKRTSRFKSRASFCDMLVTFHSGASARYSLLLDFDRHRVDMSLAGGSTVDVLGVSYGFYEDSNSGFFDWLVRNKVFDYPRKDLRFCMPYRDRPDGGRWETIPIGEE